VARADHLRCFVALDLPEAFREEAGRAQERLRELDLFQGKFTAPQNIHLTLKFLGEITNEQADGVRDALRNLKETTREVRLEGAGMFAPRIIWLKLAGANTLQERVDAALGDWFAPEPRFMGHVTIARVKTARNPGALADTVRELEVAPISGQAVSFSLRRSILNPEGPKYGVLEQFNLTDE
jgi:2'-5' RNA ligase